MKTENTNNLRYGYVSDYDASRHMARVLFPDLDNLISSWLPVLVPNSKDNHDECPLSVNEHVAVMLMGTGTEQGLILGAVYDDTARPVKGEKYVRRTEYSDGTIIEYDRAGHKLTLDVQGDIELTASGKITLAASGNVKVQGSRIDLN